MIPVFFVMQKDEDELLAPWVEYYLRLTDPASIYIYDNGSTNQGVTDYLRRVELQGVNVVYDYNTSRDFENKGNLFIQLRDRLLAERPEVDLFFPLDCDEFIVARNSDGAYSSDPTCIQQELEAINREHSLGVRRANYRVTSCLNNVPGVPDTFSEAIHKKTFFGRDSSIKRLDTGYHHMVPEDVESELFIPTDIGYLHFHNRSYTSTLRSSRRKLANRVDDFNVDTLQKYWENKGRGRHLVKYFVRGKDWYYNRFLGRESVFADCSTWFELIQHAQPFSRASVDSEIDTFMLRSESNLLSLSGADQSMLAQEDFQDPSVLLSLGTSVLGASDGTGVYEPDRGFGWASSRGVMSRTRSHVDSILGQFALSFRPNTYLVDLPEGDYLVAVLGADSLFDNHYVGLTVQNTPLGEVRPLKGEYFVAKVRVHVEAGEKLRVEFSSSKSNWIASLLAITTLSSDVQVEQAFKCHDFQFSKPKGSWEGLPHR